MNSENAKSIIIAIQRQIWESQYFIDTNCNAEYYQGKLEGLSFALEGFRAIGISVSDVTKDLQNIYS